MAKQKFERTKPHVNIGTIGHVDHGKTTLTAAITACLSTIGGAKTEYDKLTRLGEKGAELPFASHLSMTENRHYAHVDCQGAPTISEHDYGCRPDGRAILIVSAADGPIPQTTSIYCLPARLGCLVVDI